MAAQPLLFPPSPPPFPLPLFPLLHILKEEQHLLVASSNNDAALGSPWCFYSPEVPVSLRISLVWASSWADHDG